MSETNTSDRHGSRSAAHPPPIDWDPARLAEDYSHFRVGQRLLLTGHSHQAWPDVARQGMLQAFEDAAADVDAKWDAAFAKAERVRDGFRALLDEPEAEIALGENTHELVTRLLSALDLRAKPKLVTTDGEFHTLRRQLGRLAEVGLEIVRVPADPVETLAERLAGNVDARTSAVLVSQVLFATSRIVPGLDELAPACREVGSELVVDAYHALGVVPVSAGEAGLGDAWILGGGYKYLQLGEGNCFLRLPAHAHTLRPVLTGWYAEFGALAEDGPAGNVVYGPGSTRFAGATYDPASHYRAARVFDFFDGQRLTAQRLREISLYQNALLARRFDELGLPDDWITRDRETPRERFGGFLALLCPDAARLRAELTERGLHTDNRGQYLRLGPAPYLTDEQLERSVQLLGHAVRHIASRA